MANSPTPSIMSNSMNMAITIFGFVLSAVFMLIICCRLLCSRFRHANMIQILHSGSRSFGSPSVERGLQGLEQNVVTSFPTVKYNQQIFKSSEDNLCTICLGDYKEKEVLRLLPKCGHAFHVSCIDVWLRQHHTCPVCRISLRIISEWRQMTMTGPLISLSAKSRFVPGALPDSMFEPPIDFQNVLLVPEQYRICSGPMIVRDVEMGESSISRRDNTKELNEGKASGELELVRPTPSIVSDSLSINQSNTTVVSMPTNGSTTTSLGDGILVDSSSLEENILPQHDRSVYLGEKTRVLERA